MTGMQLGTGQELEVLRSAAAVGIFMGAIFDLFSIIRKCTGSGIATFICDFIYALMFGTVFFIFSLSQTNYIRGFILFGMFAGAAAWCATAGRIVSAAVYGALRFISETFICPTIGFIHKIGRLLSRLFVKIGRKLKNAKKFRKTS